MLNEQEVFETWAPVIEQKTGIKDAHKIEWLTKYAHYHSLNESAGAYQTLAGVPGQGQPFAPTRTASGSGDKFPSLLPLAIQVAAKTVGFDIVPVIPMPGPTGVLTYLDYVYAGGNVGSTVKPLLIKVQSPPSGSYTVGSTYFAATAATPSGGGSGSPTQFGVNLTYVGNSRIDGFQIWRIPNSTVISTYSNGATSGHWNQDDTVQVASVFGASTTVTIYSAAIANGATSSGSTASAALTTGISANLVSALEDHIPGFTGAGPTDTTSWTGPYEDPTLTDYSSGGFVDPMNRETGETTYYRSMGLKTFTKFVEAKTFQVAASVTTEQIQDLNKQFGIDVVSMVENALVNEVSQSINRHILGQAFQLGLINATNFAATENQSLNLNLNLQTQTQTRNPTGSAPNTNLNPGTLAPPT